MGARLKLRVLCTGDIHVGRRLSKVEETYRTADAWKTIVDLAIGERVDLLALSGDVIDAASKSYEALGPMLDGLASLSKAGIDTVAVTGNHDFDVLPRIADHAGSSRFHLLGRDGEWERFTLRRDGSPVLHVDGWSFSSEHVTQPPLRTYPHWDNDGIPVMGLLHGDVGVPLSRYAPVGLDELWPLDIGLLVLGHIHKPQLFSGPAGRQALYVGSPWAMDPGEPGIHGVWVASIDDGSVSLEQIAIAPVRYESHDVDCAGVEDEDGFQRLLSETLMSIGQNAIVNSGQQYLSTVSLRLHFHGASNAHYALPGWVERAASEIQHFPVDSVELHADVFECDVRPRLDLDDLAQGADPVADTARVILALQGDALNGDYRELV